MKEEYHLYIVFKSNKNEEKKKKINELFKDDIILLNEFVKNSEIPDEDLSLNQNLNSMIKTNNPHLFKWEESRNKSIKVIDILKKKEHFLFYRFLHNPSGTAAGNTYEEAFIQGLCEIFERYCGKTASNPKEVPYYPSRIV